MFLKDIGLRALFITQICSMTNAQKEGKILIELLGDDGEFTEHMADWKAPRNEADFMSPALSWQQSLFGRDHPIVQGNGN